MLALLIATKPAAIVGKYHILVFLIMTYLKYVMIRNTNSIVFLYADNSIVLVTIKAALDKAKYNFEFNI